MRIVTSLLFSTLLGFAPLSSLAQETSITPITELDPEPAPEAEAAPEVDELTALALNPDEVISAEARDEKGLAVAVMRVLALPNVPNLSAGVVIKTPLNTLLIEKVSVKIDSGATAQYDFTLCQVDGCIVRYGLDEAGLNRYKRGTGHSGRITDRLHRRIQRSVRALRRRRQSKHSVQPTKGECIGQSDANVSLLSCIGHNVQIAVRVRLVISHSRCDDAITHRHDTGQHLNRARATNEMAMHRFG